MTSTFNSILPQDHFPISNFVWDSLMSQLTSIVSKRRKARSKRRNYLEHTIVQQKTAQIRSKMTVQLNHLYLYGREYTDDKKSPAYFRPNILYLYEHKYRISVHHPRCKNHHKRLPRVTIPCCTTLHMNIHMYTLI